jgi:hypothetical protein
MAAEGNYLLPARVMILPVVAIIILNIIRARLKKKNPRLPQSNEERRIISTNKPGRCNIARAFSW